MKNLFRLRLIWLFMLFCMIPLWALSQNITVKGIVKDGAGESVIGASVLQKGTTNGTITDFEGGFTLTLNPQLHSRSATYIKRNGLLIRKITIKSSRPFQCAYHPLTP